MQKKKMKKTNKKKQQQEQKNKSGRHGHEENTADYLYQFVSVEIGLPLNALYHDIHNYLR